MSLNGFFLHLSQNHVLIFSHNVRALVNNEPTIICVFSHSVGRIVIASNYFDNHSMMKRGSGEYWGIRHFFTLFYPIWYHYKWHNLSHSWTFRLIPNQILSFWQFAFYPLILKSLICCCSYIKFIIYAELTNTASCPSIRIFLHEWFTIWVL